MLDRVRQAGLVRCGGVLRPGLAQPGPDGQPRGLEVEVCHAIAVAALGVGGRYEFSAYAPLTHSFDRVRSGSDDVSFLTLAEALGEHAEAVLAPGPAVFFKTQAVMVKASSPFQKLDDLRGARICAEPGTGTERSLVAWFNAHGIPIHYFMFQEAEEQADAFAAGVCDAVADEATALAASRIALRQAGEGRQIEDGRILEQPLAAAPLMADTPRRDGDWTALVTWTIDTLIRGEEAGSASPGGGADAIPLEGVGLGQAAGWQHDVLSTVGTYGTLYEAAVGAKSPLELPRRLNGLWSEGGLMCPPYSD